MNRISWMLTGASALLLLKYGVFGLDAWNGALHPGLVPAPNQQSFRKPFLGLLECRPKPKPVYQEAGY